MNCEIKNPANKLHFLLLSNRDKNLWILKNLKKKWIQIYNSQLQTWSFESMEPSLWNQMETDTMIISREAWQRYLDLKLWCYHEQLSLFPMETILYLEILRALLLLMSQTENLQLETEPKKKTWSSKPDKKPGHQMTKTWQKTWSSNFSCALLNW